MWRDVARSARRSLASASVSIRPYRAPRRQRLHRLGLLGAAERPVSLEQQLAQRVSSNAAMARMASMRSAGSSTSDGQLARRARAGAGAVSVCRARAALLDRRRPAAARPRGSAGPSRCRRTAGPPPPPERATARLGRAAAAGRPRGQSARRRQLDASLETVAHPFEQADLHLRRLPIAATSGIERVRRRRSRRRDEPRHQRDVAPCRRAPARAAGFSATSGSTPSQTIFGRL